MILLSQPLKYWDYRSVPPHLEGHSLQTLVGVGGVLFLPTTHSVTELSRPAARQLAIGMNRGLPSGLWEFEEHEETKARWRGVREEGC